jgi:hypothetical protein
VLELVGSTAALFAAGPLSVYDWRRQARSAGSSAAGVVSGWSLRKRYQ